MDTKFSDTFYHNYELFVVCFDQKLGYYISELRDSESWVGGAGVGFIDDSNVVFETLRDAEEYYASICGEHGMYFFDNRADAGATLAELEESLLDGEETLTEEERERDKFLDLLDEAVLLSGKPRFSRSQKLALYAYYCESLDTVSYAEQVARIADIWHVSNPTELSPLNLFVLFCDDAPIFCEPGKNIWN